MCIFFSKLTPKQQYLADSFPIRSNSMSIEHLLCASKQCCIEWGLPAKQFDDYNGRNLRGHHLNNPFISWMSINMKLTGAACLCGPFSPPPSSDKKIGANNAEQSFLSGFSTIKRGELRNLIEKKNSLTPWYYLPIIYEDKSCWLYPE